MRSHYDRPPEPLEPGEADAVRWPDPRPGRGADGWWEDARAFQSLRRIEGEGEGDGFEDETPLDASAEPMDDAETDASGGGWWDLARTLFYAVLVALVVRTLFFQPYNIPSGSMESTLLVGDYLFVEKFSYGYSRYALPWGRYLPSFGRIMASEPKRGDVVVFVPPDDPSQVFIKRLVGLPGDRIRMSGGVLYINDAPVPKMRVSDYIDDENGYQHHVARYRETLPGGKSYDVLDGEQDGPADDTRTYVVPPGKYFMMGDNRDDSNDSRMDVGYVPAENLIGKAQFRFFSINGEKAKFWQFWTWPSAIRFDRMFTVID